MAKTRNLWNNATKEMVEEHVLDLQDFMSERGFDIEDHFTDVQLNPTECIPLGCQHKSGYIRPLKIRDSFSAVAIWLYKDYCQEEPNPEDYHTIKICETGGCIQPNHYISAPKAVSVFELKNFLKGALGQYWYQEYLSWGTWVKAWEAAWRAMEATPTNGLALLHATTGKFKGHGGLATDAEALQLIKGEFSWEVNIYQWLRAAEKRYYFWVKQLREQNMQNAQADLDAIIASLSAEQKLVLLDKIHRETAAQSTTQVVAPFEQEV